MLFNQSTRSLPTLDPRINLLSSHWYGSRIYRQIGEGEELGVGTTVPDSDDGDEQLQAPGLKALEEWKKRAKELEKQNKQLQQKYSGINPEEVERLRQESERREQEELERKSEYQAALKISKEKYENELSAARNEAQQLSQKLQQTVIQQAVVDAFLECGGRRGDSPKAYAQLLMPAIADQLRVEDGEVIVVDKNGDQRFNLETGGTYTLTDLMNDCRKKGATALFFEPQDKASGAGATANGRRIGSDKMKELDNLPRAERIARARELGIL
jgi:antitoxin component of MazEF toxin-antitoxin module